MKRFLVLASLTASLGIVGCSHQQDKPATQTTTSDSMAPVVTTGSTAGAVDLHNTVCPVSGEKVETSALTETYNGKTYHMCDAGCAKDFKKNPQKYADMVAADPAKYGVKTDAPNAQ
ncbi:MAG TPA: YHS domain-containing protein [Tepidisphaeraceae bacterium]|nr:YHS domain-containing protein [Tepidisphaeraceae bacterium]